MQEFCLNSLNVRLNDTNYMLEGCVSDEMQRGFFVQLVHVSYEAGEI